MFGLRRKKKQEKLVVLGAEVPDGINLELNTEKTPTLYTPPPYVPPTDKEMIEGLEFCDNYEAAFRIRDLKKQNMILKGKLTVLRKKYENLHV